MEVNETLTDLCPGSICATEEELGADLFLTRVRQSLLDASVVCGHVVVSPDWRSDLPTVDQSWEGFFEQAEEADFESVSVDPGSLSANTLDEEDRTEFFERMREQNQDAFSGFKGRRCSGRSRT